MFPNKYLGLVLCVAVAIALAPSTNLLSAQSETATLDCRIRLELCPDDIACEHNYGLPSQDDDSNLYVLETEQKHILKFDPIGVLVQEVSLSEQWPTDQELFPQGLAYDNRLLIHGATPVALITPPTFYSYDFETNELSSLAVLAAPFKLFYCRWAGMNGFTRLGNSDQVLICRADRPITAGDGVLLQMIAYAFNLSDGTFTPLVFERIPVIWSSPKPLIGGKDGYFYRFNLGKLQVFRYPIGTISQTEVVSSNIIDIPIELAQHFDNILNGQLVGIDEQSNLYFEHVGYEEGESTKWLHKLNVLGEIEWSIRAKTSERHFVVVDIIEENTFLMSHWQSGQRQHHHYEECTVRPG